MSAASSFSSDFQCTFDHFDYSVGDTVDSVRRIIQTVVANRRCLSNSQLQQRLNPTLSALNLTPSFMQTGILSKRVVRIICGYKIKGMRPNTLFLANLEFKKNVELNSVSSFSGKILSSNTCLHTFLPIEHNNDVLSKIP